MELIKQRRTCRDYDQSYEIPKKHLDMLVDACKLSPSFLYLQPADVIVCTDRDKIDTLTMAAFKTWKPEHQKLFIDRKHQYGVRNVVTCDAPVVMFFVMNGRGSGDLAQVDIGVMSMAVMITAKDLGYDTMGLGVVNFGDKSIIEKGLGIPEGKLCMGIAIGKAKPKVSLGKRENKITAKFI